MRYLLFSAACLAFAATSAQQPPANVALTSRAAQAVPNHVKDVMRAYVVRLIPPILYESSPGWGHTKRAPSRIKWQGQGLNTHARLVETDKKEGLRLFLQAMFGANEFLYSF